MTIAAKDLKFLQTEVTVPANQPFALTLDNQEAAPHNIHVTGPNGEVSHGETFAGPGQRTQQVPALAPGQYPFLCDVHPDMKGTITAQ